MRQFQRHFTSSFFVQKYYAYYAQSFYDFNFVSIFCRKEIDEIYKGARKMLAK